MDDEARGTVDATLVGRALQTWSDAHDRLVEVFEAGGLDAVDDLGLVAVLRRVEQVRNRSARLDHQLVGECGRRDLAGSLTQPSLTAVLVWALRLSRGEASRRVRAAEDLAARCTMTGAASPPLRPTLAAVQASGDATPEQVDVCLRALDQVDRRGIDPADVDAAETLLAQFATTFPPAELRSLAVQVVDRIDPDGTLPDDDLHHDRRHLELRRRRDGAWHLEGRLTPEAGAKLRTVLGPLAAPRTSTTTSGSGAPVEELDTRHHGQRSHDALEDVCDRLLRSGTLPDTGGTPTTLIVTVAAGDLATRRGHGTTSDGSTLSMRTVLRLADQAEVVTTVLSVDGGICSYGRTRRLATPGQTLALVARDRGCSFPGCDRPPEWCERHHVRAWSDGGATDLDNLTLLCRYHHRHFAARGWTCRMVDGLPTWTPPRWIDPQQRPLRNTRVSRSALDATVTTRTRLARAKGRAAAPPPAPARC